jgi:hypothetical protein
MVVLNASEESFRPRSITNSSRSLVNWDEVFISRKDEGILGVVIVGNSLRGLPAVTPGMLKPQPKPNGLLPVPVL